jgi:hypothetical protein
MKRRLILIACALPLAIFAFERPVRAQTYAGYSTSCTSGCDNNSGGTGTTLTMQTTLHSGSKPSVGDIMIVAVSYNQSATLTAPSGSTWTQIGSGVCDATGNNCLQLFQRTATSGDASGTTYNWTFGSNPFVSGILRDYSGALAVPDSCNATASLGSSATSIPIPACTPAHNDIIIGCYGPGGASFSLGSSGFGNGVIVQLDAGNFWGVGCGDQGPTTSFAGNSGATQGSAYYVSWVIAVEPAPVNAQTMPPLTAW